MAKKPKGHKLPTAKSVAKKTAPKKTAAKKTAAKKSSTPSAKTHSRDRGRVPDTRPPPGNKRK